jgi:hypothetical protein
MSSVPLEQMIEMCSMGLDSSVAAGAVVVVGSVAVAIDRAPWFVR